MMIRTVCLKMIKSDTFPEKRKNVAKREKDLYSIGIEKFSNGR